MTDISSVSTAQPSFVSLFRRGPEASARAPGRVNLIGDHTDYSGGYVLPMILPRSTYVEAAVRPDLAVHVWSANVQPSEAHRDFTLGREKRGEDWLDYVQGVTASLRAAGHVVPGMDLRIYSELPLGAGLSSSASLLVALLRVMRDLLHLILSDRDIAILAHRAETDFVGAPVGIMDQMVCALGKPSAGFFLDTAKLHFEHVPLPTIAEWVVIHSGVHHSHASGSYHDRRRECEAANAGLAVHWLRDLEGTSQSEALSRINALPSPLDARARHVVMENERVLSGVAMLRQGKMHEFGTLMNKSHASLSGDFAVSVPETDLLVDLAQGEEDVYGARLTGGGFGGSVVIAVKTGMGRQVARRVADRYYDGSGRLGAVLLPLPTC